MESVFQHVGGCGCFQVCHIFFVQLIRFISSWVLGLMVFGNYEPPWQCVRYNKNVSGSSNKYNTSWNSNDSGMGEENHALQLHHDDSSSPSISSLNLTIDNENETKFISQGSCSQLYLCDDVIFDPTSVTLVTDFGLICDEAYIPSVIIAVQMIGMIFGSNVGGQIGELYGRKLNVYISLSVMSAATFAAAWSWSWEMHVVLSFFIGLGCGGIMCSHLVYAMEFLTPKWRGRFAAMPLGNVATSIFAFVVIGLKNWRYIYMLGGGLGILFISGAFWVPESLRWLHVHGRETEMKKVLKKIMKYNRRKESVSGVLRKVNEATKQHSEEEDREEERKYTYLDLFLTSDVRSLTIKSAIVWFSANMCYFTLSFSVKSLSGDYFTNLLLSCASEIPFIFILGPSVTLLGRKITLSIFLCIGAMCTVACVVTDYASDGEESAEAIKYLAIGAKGSLSIAWSAAQMFSVELFPTVVRNLAMGFLNTVARLGGVLSSTLIPRDQQSITICFFVLSGALIIAFIIVLTLPETKDKPLMDRFVENTINAERPIDNVSETIGDSKNESVL